MSRFTDSRKRIERALLHANTLATEWNALLDPKAFQLRSEHKSDGTSVIYGRFRDLPKNDLALELGEFFYQLRAALDGLIFVTAEFLSAPNAPANENRLEFPIYDHPGRFKDCPVWKGPFPQELKDWLESVQPYSAPSSNDPNVVEYGRRLKLLHDCARKDRHRKLHMLATVPVNFQVFFDPPIPGAQIEYLSPNLLEGEAELVKVRISKEDWTDPKISFKGNLTLNITIAEMPGVVGSAISREMENLTNLASLITNDFESAFP